MEEIFPTLKEVGLTPKNTPVERAKQSVTRTLNPFANNEEDNMVASQHALISGFWANIKNGPKQDPTPKPKSGK